MSMATQRDFTAEEWKSISAAPLMAGLVVTLADVGGPVGVAKEAVAVSKAISESATDSAGELIRALSQAFKSGARPEMPSVPKDREQALSAFVAACRNAAATVAAKSPAEAQEFKTWLVSIAREAAEASKEGGFLGLGGTRVSQPEKEALAHLTSALGVTA
jgi:hypothetical protein